MADHLNTDGISLHHSVTYQATDNFALHCHPYFEVYYFVQGKVGYLVEGKRYEPAPHSLLLLAPGTFHGVRVESADSYERYAIHFNAGILNRERTPLLLSPFSGSGQEIYFEGADRFGIASYFQSLLECSELEEPLQTALIAIRTEALLSQILRMAKLESPTGAASTNRSIDRLLAYLGSNLGEDITLDSLSERFFLSKNHLNHLFKQSTGTTVKNYLVHKRVAAAHELILQGYPVANAAEICGFRDYSTFFRAYKKILGVPPASTARRAKASKKAEGGDKNDRYPA